MKNLGEIIKIIVLYQKPDQISKKTHNQQITLHLPQHVCVKKELKKTESLFWP